MHARPLDVSPPRCLRAVRRWGFNQVVVKLALPDAGPIAQTGIRSGVGALCVIAYALFTKRRIFQIDERRRRVRWPRCSREFIALYESLAHHRRARDVFITAAPFFVASARRSCFGRAAEADPMAGARVRFGVACGFLGRTKGGSLAGDALRSWLRPLAATTIVIKATPLRRIDPMKVLLYQSDSLPLTAPLAPMLSAKRGHASDDDVSNRPTVARRHCGGVSYVLWFWTLTATPSPSSRLHLHHPIVGVLAGWLVFGENEITAALLWRSCWSSRDWRSSTGRATRDREGAVQRRPSLTTVGRAGAAASRDHPQRRAACRAGGEILNELPRRRRSVELASSPIRAPRLQPVSRRVEVKCLA